MSKKTRIVHVVSSLSTYGAERLVAALAQALRGEFEVAVMTMYSPDERASVFGGTLLDVGRDGRPSFFPRMVGLLKRWQPELVHTHVHNGKYWGRLAAITAGIPAIVHTEHNSDFRAHTAVRVANRLLHARTARIVAFSEEHAGRIARAEGVPRAKFAVIPNGIAAHDPSMSRETARQALGEDDDRALVLHIGRFQAVKNQRLAVEAFAGSQALRQRARLVFIGSGPDEAAMRSLAAERGADGGIRFLGYRSDVRDLLAGADAVLMTSRNEAMPLAAIESMSAGVPIASVPWHGSAQLFHDGALAAISGSYDPADLAHTLEAVLSDRTLTQARASAARGHALREYSLEACAERHAELYGTILRQAQL
jgi:glycosyltransferase involved in cell wall biosynthesis